MTAKLTYSKEWLSKIEIKTLFEHPTISTRDLKLMQLCYYGALRISEALFAKLEDFRFEDDYSYLLLRVQKTDKKNWEKQPIPVWLYGDIVNRYCKDNKIKTQDYIFPTQKSKRMSYSMAYKIVKKCTKAAGITKEITTHSFRRSRATHLLDGDLDLYFVSKFLRHSDINTTLRYLKLSKKSLFDKVNTIDNKDLFSKIS
jgi:integrase/recombinase XerD